MSERGEFEAAAGVARDLIARSEAHALGGFTPWAEMFVAWARGHQGEVSEGIADLEAIVPRLGMVHPGYMYMLVELYLMAGRSEDYAL